MEEIVVKVDGMMCGMCEAHVSDAVRKAVPGAKKVTASHKKGEVRFTVEETLDENALRQGIDQTGYTCLSITHGEPRKRGLFGFGR